MSRTARPLQDEARLQGVLAERRSKSQEFFSSAAGQWDRLRDELFGRDSHLPPLLGLLDPAWVVGDLGCGTGQVTEALAPFVGRVVAVDTLGPRCSQAARGAARRLPNVETCGGRRSSGSRSTTGDLDAAMLMLVLHHTADPARVLAEAARVLRPGGRLLVADMLPHDRDEYRQQMGHVWLGFGERQIERWLAAAGFEAMRVAPAPGGAGGQGARPVRRHRRAKSRSGAGLKACSTICRTAVRRRDPEQA